jgi:hypothetical protein
MLTVDQSHRIETGKDRHGRTVIALFKVKYADHLGREWDLSTPDYLKAWYLEEGQEPPTQEEINREIELNDWSRWNRQPLTKDQKIEISEAIYWELLNCLPPRIHCSGYFEVGEPEHHDPKTGRAVHRACWIEGNKFYTGYPKPNAKDFIFID